jgi:putative transposase
VAKTLKRLRYPLEVTLLCVRRDVTCSLSLHDLEEIMIDRGILEDHSTVDR